MTILGPQGQPILKKWDDQDMDEKLLTLRHGIVLTMQMQDEILKLCKSISNNVETMIEAMEGEYDNNEAAGRPSGEEEVGVRTESGSSDVNDDGAGQDGRGAEQKS